MDKVDLAGIQDVSPEPCLYYGSRSDWVKRLDVAWEETVAFR